ncbi:MAG TPA: hypothetical protein VIG66_05040 [Noviherbaspirillum sp.]
MEHADEKAEYDRYAAELNERFESFVEWAMNNWPRPNYPLMPSDFDAARRVVAEIAGPKLGEPDAAKDVPDPPGLQPERKSPFRDTNPMPWP